MRSQSPNFTSCDRAVSRRKSKLLSRVLVPAAGIGFAAWGVFVVAGLSSHPSSSPIEATAASLASTQIRVAAERPSDKTARARLIASKSDRIAAAPASVAVTPIQTGTRKAAGTSNAPLPKRHWTEIFDGVRDASFASDAELDARFAKVAAGNQLTSARLASLFGSAGTVVARAPSAQRSVSGPTTARFGVAADVSAPAVAMLAYADPSPTAVSKDAFAALSGPMAENDGVLSPEDEAKDADGTAFFPDYEDTPVETPLPLVRPHFEQAQKSKARERDETPPPAASIRQQVAYARPDNPTGERGSGLGNGLKNLFSKPRVGNGVAVYDIAAAKVYMPDGSVLEAHSGIGNMADNPKYAHVKMKGPTPPHTYNLRMREKRFHGVEAIRMLPVDGKNKHGRDGFLTHSYLLRGGRAESHGCVAFKNYDKFLNAFKQGKIKQLVVVPGGGSAIARNARKGQDA
ncbi:MAG: DUF2778 domain-containing protein [Rhizobiaceae bacterium]|nr:DUF2778 domain-containing protein [Rhizobiaceae bacterium]